MNTLAIAAYIYGALLLVGLSLCCAAGRTRPKPPARPMNALTEKENVDA